MLHIQVFPFNPFSENTYVVYDNEKKAWLIDPGNFHAEETKALSQFIEQHQLKIEKILLTHAHIDHILGLQWAYDTFKTPIHLHPLEEEILKMGELSAQRFGFPFKKFVGEILYVEEGQKLYLGEEEFDIYFTPGHSPGSVCYHHKKQQFIISGDVLFQSSIGRTDLYKGNYNQLIESIQQKLLNLEEETTVLSGHGSATNIGVEKQINPFLK